MSETIGPVNSDATWNAAFPRIGGPRSDQDVRNVCFAVATVVKAIGEDLVSLGRSASDAYQNGAMTREGLRAINESTLITCDRFMALVDLGRTVTTVEAMNASAFEIRAQILDATKALALSMETTCRATIGDNDRSDALASEIDSLHGAWPRGSFIADIMRVLIFHVVAECAAKRTAWQLLSPEWCNRRDKAFANIARDLENLRAVALDSPWSQADRTAGIARTEDWLRGITEQFNSIQKPTVERDGRLVLNPLAASRRDLGAPQPSPRGGRPKETWRSEAITGLRDIGLTKENAEGLLDAAGLTAPYPNR